MSAIFLFRNDLRLSDNQALHAAANTSLDLILIYILDETHQRPLGGAARYWLHHSLISLQKSLAKQNLLLTFFRGDTQKILIKIIKQYPITHVFANHADEPDQILLENQLAILFKKSTIHFEIHHSNLLIEPDKMKNQSGEYFKVFTPFYKKFLKEFKIEIPLGKIKNIQQKTKVIGDDITAWELLPTKPNWSQGFSLWEIGEQSAEKKLKNFLTNELLNYKKSRDFPAQNSTSTLSAHLHFGEISSRQIWHQTKIAEFSAPELITDAEAFLRQLVWREFSYYLLYHFPNLATQNFNPQFNHFNWQKDMPALKAWQQGKTGYPIVDAGMRELWQTGYMHNRVRMIVASFLTKDLLIDWREGEAWFWDTLVDADLANNAFSWQWVAGSGVDAAPYFRVFNPLLQSEKFDPEGIYLRRWLPELAKLPNKYIHFPMHADETVLKTARIKLGRDYPLPIIDHQLARAKALKYFKLIRNPIITR